jgi:hypothetical protein
VNGIDEISLILGGGRGGGIGGLGLRGTTTTPEDSNKMTSLCTAGHLGIRNIKMLSVPKNNIAVSSETVLFLF